MRAVVQRVSRGWVRILRSGKREGGRPGGRESGNGRDCRSAPASAGTRQQGSHLTPPASHLPDEAEIARGLVVLLGVGNEDTEDDASHIADKVLNMRIFPDNGGMFNHSVLEVRGELLVVSQFTLYGDCRKGRRPSFTEAAPPETANHLYNLVVRRLAASGLKVETGQFQTMMEVGIINDGPVTVLIDSKKLF